MTHSIPVDKLTAFSPFTNSVWAEVDKPITRKAVQKAIEMGRMLAPVDVVLYGVTRASHIQRIAWFVRHGWGDPIEIDVGIPSLSYYNDWFVIDGNHRHAAAIFRRESHILATIGGSLDYAEELFEIGIP